MSERNPHVIAGIIEVLSSVLVSGDDSKMIIFVYRGLIDDEMMSAAVQTQSHERSSEYCGHFSHYSPFPRAHPSFDRLRVERTN